VTFAAATALTLWLSAGTMGITVLASIIGLSPFK